MAFCPKCGKTVPEGTPFCSACGTELGRSRTGSPSAPANGSRPERPPIRTAPGFVIVRDPENPGLLRKKKIRRSPLPIVAGVLAGALLIGAVLLLTLPKGGDGSAETTAETAAESGLPGQETLPVFPTLFPGTETAPATSELPGPETETPGPETTVPVETEVPTVSETEPTEVSAGETDAESTDEKESDPWAFPTETDETPPPETDPSENPEIPGIAALDFAPIVAGRDFIAAVEADGSFRTTSEEIREAVGTEFDGARALAVSSTHLIALLEDGTARVLTLDSDKDLEKVRDWENLAAVAAGHKACFGLTVGGRVLCDGLSDTDDVDSWSTICSISATDKVLFGVRSDHAVLRLDPENWFPDVSGWQNIRSLACEKNIVAGLRYDGTVVVAVVHARNVDPEKYGKAEAEQWRDIQAVAVADAKNDRQGIIGLTNNGRVLCAGDLSDWIRQTEEWTDIVQIRVSANAKGTGCYVLGLKSDGSLEIAGDIEPEDERYQTDVFGEIRTNPEPIQAPIPS